MRVHLNEVPVGTLSIDASGATQFRLLQSYRDAYPRPVLGQVFLDDLDRTQTTRARVPPWFSNLLPEGPLRSLVAKAAAVAPEQEYALLHYLGLDLPGAVRIVPDETSAAAAADSVASTPGDGSDGLHFSLAGVQLKFSANRDHRGLTIPASGLDGDWIVKLPDARFPEVPQNEFATMQWARASGIEVPEIDLVPLADIGGLPPSNFGVRDTSALAVRRFDRPAPGLRTHIEDFAQVLGLYPEQKYQRHNYETLARLVLALTGPTGLNEFLLRLVFVVASGNGDAHHKNWSLIYRDPTTPQLSPAYDLLSTIQYLPRDGLALNLARSKSWADVSIESFQRMARKLLLDEQAFVEQVRRSSAAVLDAWRAAAGDFGFDKTAREVIDSHIRSIPLFR